MDATALLDALRRHWGYRAFRPSQAESVEQILAGRDSLTVLPTGGGKSVCYQLPALADVPGLAVVVSPLVSLMAAQVDELVRLGVAAAYLNSSLTPGQQRTVLARLHEGRYRILYVTPERLMTSRALADVFARLGLRYVAVDEAHCISHWGHDFRAEYRELGRLRELYPETSIHAFTATATSRVRQDIVDNLRLREPQVLVGDFDRPNLTYRAVRRQDQAAQIRDVIRRHAGEAGIVYAIARKDVDRLAASLQSDGVQALPYHAGLDDATRKRNQDAFLNEAADVMVATVAFGMGIDRSNVRFVLHASAPKSLEHYQQEAGRAGRDGLPAECVLIYSPADFMTWRRILEGEGTWNEMNATLLRHMERFATQTRCRHQVLLEYFGQDHPGECGACDWCLGELEAVPEPVILAQKILSCVLRLRESWGMGQVMDVLRGRDTVKVRERRHDQLSTFGLLADVPIPELRGYIEQLVAAGYIAQAGDRYPILQVTPDGRRLLKAQVDVELYRYKRVEKRKAAKKARRLLPATVPAADQGLFERLREWRREVARERGIPPYVVAHDATLKELVRTRPTTIAELEAVHGMGEKKIDDYGEAILSVLRVEVG